MEKGSKKERNSSYWALLVNIGIKISTVDGTNIEPGQYTHAFLGVRVNTIGLKQWIISPNRFFKVSLEFSKGIKDIHEEESSKNTLIE